MNKKISVSVALAITIIAMTVTFSITWLLSMYTFDNTVSAVTRLQAQYAKLAEIDTYMRGNFYGEIDDNYLFDRVALGYINGLGDRYSAYYTEKEYTDLLAFENGVISDIGVEILREADGSFRIARVYADSPAQRAGLQKNAVITEVNGVSASGFTTARGLQSSLRGEDGTDLALVCRTGVADEESITVHRAKYVIPTVEWKKLGDYAYIRVSTFTAATANDFELAVHQAVAQDVKGFLFDLRGNNIGMFRDCYSMIDLLCPRGTVAKSVNKVGVVSVLATSDENEIDLPMAVLVNGNTAGPAELFAASIRDLAGGQVLGVRTLGKGSIQSAPRRLSDGSAVTVTTAMLLTGGDENFDEAGITPAVELSGDEVTEEMLLDPQPLYDNQALRSFEVLRVMVREAGGDPGEAVTPANADTPGTSLAPDGGDAPSSTAPDGGEGPQEEDGSAGDEPGGGSGAS